MRNAATERGKGFRDRRGGAENAWQIAEKPLAHLPTGSQSLFRILLENRKKDTNTDTLATDNKSMVGGKAKKEFLKMTERSLNVYENKGPLWKTRERSWNVYENTGT
jgi:hypothetical protein